MWWSLSLKYEECESTSLCNAPRFLKEQCFFFEGS
jgi:hypothetical protein